MKVFSRHQRLLLVAPFAVAFCVFAGTLSAKPNTSQNKPTMKQFALLFTAGSQPLSDSDLQLRAKQISAWAAEQNKAGRKLEPRGLGKDHLIIRPDHKINPISTSSDGHVTVILFLEAKDFEDAVKVAASHPGLNFGATVEVRSWAPPIPPK